MRRLLSRLTAGLFAALTAAGPAAAQFNGPVFATPLPPGPGTVPYIPNGKLVAPVLLPVCAPTAAPVAIYHYPPSVGAQAAMVDCGQVVPCEESKRRGGRWWASADFLYGATQGVWVPPLVTTAPAPVSLGTAGALYDPNTVVRFGGRRELTSTRPGFQLGAGYWFDDAQTRGVEAGLIYLGDLTEEFVASSGPGGLVLARPFVALPSGVNGAFPVANPFPGGITASADTRFIGGDVNYRRALSCGDCCRVDLLLGYRYLHLGDTVDVWTAGGSILPAPGVVLSPVIHDSFLNRNHFHGGQVGLATGCRLASGLTLELVTKVALGVTVAEADVEGTTGLGGLVLPTGLLAAPSNRVADTETYFGVVPEARLRLGYCVTDCLKLTGGYTFLYWSEVRRASEQIDLGIDPLGGRPAPRNDTSDFWVQGWTLGVELRY